MSLPRKSANVHLLQNKERREEIEKCTDDGFTKPIHPVIEKQKKSRQRKNKEKQSHEGFTEPLHSAIQKQLKLVQDNDKEKQSHEGFTEPTHQVFEKQRKSKQRKNKEKQVHEGFTEPTHQVIEKQKKSKQRKNKSKYHKKKGPKQQAEGIAQKGRDVVKMGVPPDENDASSPKPDGKLFVIEQFGFRALCGDQDTNDQVMALLTRLGKKKRLHARQKHPFICGMNEIRECLHLDEAQCLIISNEDFGVCNQKLKTCLSYSSYYARMNCVPTYVVNVSRRKLGQTIGVAPTFVAMVVIRKDVAAITDPWFVKASEMLHFDSTTPDEPEDGLFSFIG